LACGFQGFDGFVGGFQLFGRDFGQRVCEGQVRAETQGQR
jgi:hypothetical protein